MTDWKASMEGPFQAVYGLEPDEEATYGVMGSASSAHRLSGGQGRLAKGNRGHPRDVGGAA